MNKAILIGRTTKEIELRYTQSNTPVATTTLAVNRPKQKDKEQEADFINLVIWGKQAENCKNYVNKGNQIAIEGRIQTRSYDDDKGNKRYVTEVVAENVQFLENKKDGQAQKQVSEQVVQTKDPFAEMGAQVEQEAFAYDSDDLPF